MALKSLPKFVEVELAYPYMDSPVTYRFPRLRKKDVELDRLERLKGDGHKENPAVRLAGLVEDIRGLEEFGFEPRSENESDGQFGTRVMTFFNNEDMQEIAEHALIFRTEAVFPRTTFRSGTDSSLAVDRPRGSSGPRVSLSDVRAPSEGSPE